MQWLCHHALYVPIYTKEIFKNNITALKITVTYIRTHTHTLMYIHKTTGQQYVIQL